MHPARFLIPSVENRACGFYRTRLHTFAWSPWGDHGASVPIAPVPRMSTRGQLARSLGTCVSLFSKARGLRRQSSSSCTWLCRVGGAALPPPSPLRTVRDHCQSHGSSLAFAPCGTRFHHGQTSVLPLPVTVGLHSAPFLIVLKQFCQSLLQRGEDELFPAHIRRYNYLCSQSLFLNHNFLQIGRPLSDPLG